MTMTQTLKEEQKDTLVEQFRQALSEDEDVFRPLIQTVVQELLEEEMNEAIGARKGERTMGRLRKITYVCNLKSDSMNVITPPI